MHLYQGSVILLICSMVWTEAGEGSTSLSHNTDYGRHLANVSSALHGSSVGTALGHGESGTSAKSVSDTHFNTWKMFLARGKSEKLAQKPTVKPSGLSDQQGMKSKLPWERASRINRDNTHPSEILSIAPADLARATCQTLPFIQKIFQKNCHELQIPNRFCFGQCNSFYLPGWQSHMAQPCEACVPSRSRKSFVPLHCIGGAIAWVGVEMIEECECMTQY